MDNILTLSNFSSKILSDFDKIIYDKCYYDRILKIINKVDNEDFWNLLWRNIFGNKFVDYNYKKNFLNEYNYIVKKFDDIYKLVKRAERLPFILDFLSEIKQFKL